MIVTGLDGKEYKWNFSKYHKRKNRAHSALHNFARPIIEQAFPNHNIYEEVTLPGSDLYADFYIPSLAIIIEIHGEQHYHHIPFFHKTYAEFLRGRNRDKKKKEWCDINSIRYIELPYDKKEEWLNICQS